MERQSSTTASQATSCLVLGNERANWTDHGLGLLPLALVSQVREFLFGLVFVCLFVCLQFVAATSSFVIQSVVKLRQMKLNAWGVNSTSDIDFLNLLSWIYLAPGYCFTGVI